MALYPPEERMFWTNGDTGYLMCLSDVEDQTRKEMYVKYFETIVIVLCGNIF